MTKGLKPVMTGIGAVMVAAIIIVLLQQHRPTVEEPQVPFQPWINQFIYDGWNFTIGKTIAEIESNLGIPLRVERERVQNIHNPKQTDEVYEMIYDGLSITVYKAAESRKEIITEIVVTCDKYPMKWGLNVGSPIGIVTKNLGTPSKKDKENDVYIYGTDEAPSYVSFHCQRDIVYKIEWEFYID